MATVFTEQGETRCASARVDGDGLWLSSGDLAAVTGWTLKPEGLCRGEICVPVPPSRATELVDGAEVNVAAFWRYMGQPVIHDDAGELWVLGTGADRRAEQLRSLEAPDFTLPDLDGRMHALSRYRGRKVMLVSWASW